MAETIIIQEEAVKEKNRLAKVAQKTIHLGLGAAAIAQDEIVTLFEKAQTKLNSLVEQTQQNADELMGKAVKRGSSVETDGRERVNGLVKESKKQANKVQGTLEEQVERVLHRMNVPTRKDIEEIEKSLDVLNKKLNKLSK